MEKGASGFDLHYRAIYGDRWTALREALHGEPAYAELGPPLASPYFLDSASVEAARALPVSGNVRILDMCAAPGGKSLVIASAMGPGSSLTANELSGQRRERLRRVLSEHLPLDILARVTVTGYDASAWLLHEREGFDRILLDAPCSSERHLLSSEKHLSTWTPSRSRHLAVRQFALLASAIEVVKVGGIVVYSTCSISPLENDEVVRKLLRKRPGRIEVVRQAGTAGEETEFGKYFLPDRSGGKGPIYYTVLRRIT